ncbi:transposase [Alteromonas sp. 345S023]|uniref:Transposase n=2 Tax=Alteromonas profundi TaxID=2696062 RepID=A0A7X5LKI2_9ALTE|nr:transposase [Alteromonas profundi]
MSNHTHVVLHVDKQKAEALSHEEVLRRWHKLHKGTLLTRKYVDVRMRNTMSEAERDSVILCANIYRKRLHDISWFMRHLNEYIARMANKEDECTGRFWEGRFKSQALLDEAALLACMAYVDLNPIRAGKAATPEKAAYTSVKRRIKAAKNNQQPRKLMPFTGNQRTTNVKGLPFVLADYLALVEHTGRQLRCDKPGVIPSHCAPLLQRTGLQLDCWDKLVNGIESEFSTRISVAITHSKLAG